MQRGEGPGVLPGVLVSPWATEMALFNPLSSTKPAPTPIRTTSPLATSTAMAFSTLPPWAAAAYGCSRAKASGPSTLAYSFRSRAQPHELYLAESGGFPQQWHARPRGGHALRVCRAARQRERLFPTAAELHAPPP